MVCKYCKTENSPNATFCINCGAQIEVPTASQAPQVEAQKAAINNTKYSFEKPMGWFKFLIYFSLFASAFLNLLHAILIFTGHAYISATATAGFYITYPAMQVLDIIYAIILVALAGFLVFTRFQLAGFKKNAPKMIVAIYVINAVVPFAYLIFSSIFVGVVRFEPDAISSLLISIVMAVANNSYFKNRKEMFVK